MSTESGSSLQRGAITPSSSAISQLRDCLDRTGFNQSALRAAFGASGLGIAVGHIPYHVRRLSAPPELHVLIRLFLLGLPTAPSLARDALYPLSLDSARKLGIIASSAGPIIPMVRLTAYDDMVVAYDAWSEYPEVVASDHVLGVTPSARTLSFLTPRTSADLTLDIGTGCGIQALMASRHSRLAVGTDINLRALEFAHLNSLLNSTGNMRLLALDGFRGMVGSFDLIVSNPPFVISPERRYAYRDSGLIGDSMAELLVRESAKRLRSGGSAVLLLNWGYERSQEWHRRPSAWVKDSGCDTILLRFREFDALSYAFSCNKDLKGSALDKVLEEWLSYFSRIGVDRVSLGAAIMRRRRGGDGWIAQFDVPAAPESNASEQLNRMFTASSWLREVGSSSRLLDSRLRLAHGAVLREEWESVNGRRGSSAASVRMASGIPINVSIGRELASIISESDGSRPLSEILHSGRDVAGQLDGASVHALQTLIAGGLLEF